MERFLLGQGVNIIPFKDIPIKEGLFPSSQEVEIEEEIILPYDPTLPVASPSFSEFGSVWKVRTQDPEKLDEEVKIRL